MESGTARATSSVLRTAIAVAICVSAHFAGGQELQKARVTKVINDVKLLPNQAAPRPAAINDEVKTGTAVRTGTDSRTELTFADLTITRLGANTVFSFKPGARELKLTNGAVLISVPPNAPEVKISTAAVTAAISGGTCIFDAATGKFMVLEGVGKIWPTGHPELAVTVQAGEMVWLTPTGNISQPEKFNVALVVETSLLITDFAQLPNWPFIVQVITAQAGESGNPPLPPGKPPEDVISQKDAASPTPSPSPSPSETPAPTPTPTPNTPTPTPSPATPTPTPSPATPTPTPSPATPTPTPSPATPTPTPTPASTPTPTPTPASTPTPTPTPASTPTPTPTPASTPTPTPTPASTPTPTPTPASTPTPTPTPASTPTPTPASTPTPTPTPASTPTPTPSEFGPPQTISSPVPYIINSSTVITTDPTITTNGVTDFGTIYRGPSTDGPLSTFAFGSTSSFDTSSGFDAQITVSGAVFKFTALQITGNPTIDVTNGQNNLALIGVNSITSGPPGGALTFNGLNGLLLATVNGPISFGSEVSFSAFRDLTMYARGSLSDLTLGADINVNHDLHLYAEHDMAITSMVRAPRMSFVAGNDISFSNLATNETITQSSGDVTLNAGHNISSSQQIQIGRVNGGISSGLNVTLDAGNDLTTATDLLISVDNSNASLDSGGNIFVRAGGTLMTGGIFDAQLDNSNGGTRAGGAIIDIAANNIAIANNLTLTINNSLGGSISQNASIFLSAPVPVPGIINGPLAASNGNINIGGDAVLRILNFGDTAGSNGGLIGGSAFIDISPVNLSANSLTADIDSSQGGGIDQGASINVSVDGTLTTTHDANFTIETTPPTFRPATAAAASDASINFNGGSYEVGGTFRATITGGDGTVAFSFADVHADVIKVGVFGDTGVLKIGGGAISADTVLRLYATGSNGMIDFVNSVTLTNQSAAVVLAAETVTIEDNVRVTIAGGGGPALVFTTVPNYTGSGGNGSTSGMFLGNGATTHPLSEAPDFETGATPTPGPTPSKFGTPATIASPNPYVVGTGTVISTDPAITTNGQTDFGKIYRDPATDGSRSQWLFGSTSSFDSTSGFENGPDTSTFLNNIAVFKFQGLLITGGPTISREGGATSLGLIGVDGITTGPPGGTFDLTGIDSFLLATQNGSINLAPGVSFVNGSRMFVYARGDGADLTIGSNITTNNDLRLYAQNSVTINGDLTTANFSSFSGGDFLGGTGTVTAAGIYITSAQGSITFDAAHFSVADFMDTSLSLVANQNVDVDVSTEQSVFNRSTSINVSAGNKLTITGDTGIPLFLNVSSPAVFSAGVGGIQASTVDFRTTGGLNLLSAGDINILQAEIPFGGSGRTISGTINAAGAIHSIANITSGDVTAGTSITVGGDFFASNATAGSTIDVTGNFSLFGTATAGGDITANGINIPTINAPTGVLNVGNGGIHPFVVLFGPGDGPDLQHTFNVDSIVSPNGIDFSGNQFGSAVNNPGPGGKLTINATTLTFDTATGIGNVNFNGADQGAFGPGNPAAAGSGGVFIANTTGNITANAGTDITATTGIQSSDDPPSGVGGTVTLHSSGGTVSVNDIIQVSSDDSRPTAGSAPIRSSASGGTIVIRSDLTNGTGLGIGGSAQLLSLLNPNAPGDGGSIVLLTSGADINIASGAILEADHGNISISNSGGPSFSQINIDGAVFSSETLNISSSGFINVGSSNPVSVTAVTVNVFTPGNLDWVSPLFLPDIGSRSNATVQFIADQFMNFGSDIDITRGSGDTNNGMNVTFSAGTGLSVGGHLSIHLTPDLIDTGGNTSISTALGDIAINGPSTLNTTIATDLMSGGNILVSAAPSFNGSLTASSIQAGITNDPGVTVGDGANITFGSGGDIRTTGPDASDGITLFVDNRGAHIGQGGNIAMNAGGDIITNGPASFTIDNSGGGQIDSLATTVQVTASNLTAGSLSEVINNQDGGVLSGKANVVLNVSGDVTTTSGGVTLQILKQNTTGNGFIGNDALVSATVGNLSSAGPFLASIYNNFVGSAIHGNASVDISTIDFSVGTALAPAMATAEMTNIFATIDGNAAVGLDASGAINVNGDAAFQLFNGMINTASAGGHIGGQARVGVGGNSVSVSGALTVGIDNTASFINNDAFVSLSSNNDVTAGDTFVYFHNSTNALDQVSEIDGNVHVDISAGQKFTANSIFALVNDRNGGIIGGSAALNFTIGDALTTSDTAQLVISTRPQDSAGQTGSIGTNASILLSANSVDIGTDLITAVATNGGGRIGGNATVTVDVTNALSAATGTFRVENSWYPNGSSFFNGGSITGDAVVSVSAGSMSISDFMEAAIWSHSGGTIGGNANLTLSVTGALDVTNSADVYISTLPGDTSKGPGSIGDSASITVSAGSITTGGDFNTTIYNDFGGQIGGAASITETIGTMNVTGDLFLRIFNYGNTDNMDGGQIGESASISLTAGDVTANSLLALIDSSHGGAIGTDATITMDISGRVTTTGDATFDIELATLTAAKPRSPTVATAGNAINFNGGTYDVGGTFRATIGGGDGTVNINAAVINADVIKVGAFGDKGVLQIGGGSINANTMLKLYAPGSNGFIDFVASVTLSSRSGGGPIIVANTVTIENNVTVTISGTGGAAVVYTNNPNYMGSGGNGTTNGKFDGLGATTNSLASSTPPPFDEPAITTSQSNRSGSNLAAGAGAPGDDSARPRFGGSRPATATKVGPTVGNPPPNTQPPDSHTGVRVADTDQLLDLIDNNGSSSSPGDGKTAGGRHRKNQRPREKQSQRRTNDSRSRPERDRDDRSPFPGGNR